MYQRIEFILKTMKTPGPDASPNSWRSKNNLIQTLSDNKKGQLPNSFYKAHITLIPNLTLTFQGRKTTG